MLIIYINIYYLLFFSYYLELKTSRYRVFLRPTCRLPQNMQVKTNFNSKPIIIIYLRYLSVVLFSSLNDMI